ncbi:MAG: trypsin-like peptidase domain-containing protein, partial [Flavobacteriaceae bacterium]
MKNILFLLFFLLLSSTIYSQIHSVKNNLDSNEKLLYYNEVWQRTTDINDAMYYRVYLLDSQKIASNVRDYYRSGRLHRYHQDVYKIRNNDSKSVFGGESYILDINGDTIAKHYFPSFNWSNNLKWNDENLVKENFVNTNNNYLVGIWTTFIYQGTPVKYIILYIKNEDRFYVTSENGSAFYINKTLSDNNFEMHLYAKKNKKKRDGYSYNPFSGNETYLKEVGERGYDYSGGDLNFFKKLTFVTRKEQLITKKLGLYLEDGIFTLSNGQVFDKIYPNKPFLKPGEWLGNGSGIIISKSGYIVTNYHVIEDADDIEVEFILDEEVQKFNAKVVQEDVTNDLAIIKIVDI